MWFITLSIFFFTTSRDSPMYSKPIENVLIPSISIHFGPWSLLISHFKVPGTYYTLVVGLLNKSPFQWQFANKRRHLDYANVNNKRPQGCVLECVWKKRQVATRTSLFWRGQFELQGVKRGKNRNMHLLSVIVASLLFIYFGKINSFEIL